MVQRDGTDLREKPIGGLQFSSGFVTESRAAKDSRISDTNWNFVDFDSTFFELVGEFL